MELRQLEYFVAVAEEAHFTRAARRLHLAQSGLSASIRSLERELGAPLFVRSTRRVELTDAGRALLPEARRTLAGAESAKDVVAGVSGLLRGTLRVGTLQCMGGVSVPDLLADFCAKHPGVEITLAQEGPGALLSGVRSGEFDLAFTAVDDERAAGLDRVDVESEPMVLACALDHPFAQRGTAVTLAEAARERFVDFADAWGTREVADRMFAGSGHRRRVGLQVNDVHTLLELVTHGLGVAALPEHFRHKTDQCVFLPLEGAHLWRTAAVTRPRAQTSAAALVLLDLVRDA